MESVKTLNKLLNDLTTYRKDLLNRFDDSKQNDYLLLSSTNKAILVFIDNMILNINGLLACSNETELNIFITGELKNLIKKYPLLSTVILML